MSVRVPLASVIVAVVSAAVGAGLGVGIIAWEPWDNEGKVDDGGSQDHERVSSEFCDEAEKWHTAQEPFLIRVDEEGSRTGSGLSRTYDFFIVAANVRVPASNNEAEDDVRSLLRDVVRFEEAWLSELATFDEITSQDSNASVSERIASRRRGEEQRIELNDLLRETNAQLGEVCGLPPLPIYE